MMRQFLAGASALVLAAQVWATDIVDGVAAIVNDRVITYSDVKDLVHPVVAQLRRNYSGQELIERVRSAQMDALNTLIERALIIHEFKDKGFSIPEQYVEAQINEIIAEEFGGDRAAFIKTLQAQNITLSQYRDQVRDRIIVQAMRTRKAQQEVIISPFKINKYYEENLDEFKVDDQIKLRMIFIKKGEPQPVAPPPPPTPASTEPEDAEEADEESAEQAEAAVEAPAEPPAPLVDPRLLLAQEILAKLDEGDSFESLARVYSEGREARLGGDWGWIGRDVLRKELNETAFSLQAGEHSRIIETPEGYYILQVNDIKPAHTKSLSAVRDDIERTLVRQRRDKMQEDWVKELRAKAYIRLF